jgi:hypothetical protein
MRGVHVVPLSSGLKIVPAESTPRLSRSIQQTAAGNWFHPRTIPRQSPAA